MSLGGAAGCNGVVDTPFCGYVHGGLSGRGAFRLRFLARSALVATGVVVGLTAAAPVGEAGVAPGVATPALPISPPAPRVTPPPLPASPVQAPDTASLSVPDAVPDVGAPTGLAADGRGGSLVSGRAVGDGEAGTFAADQSGSASGGPLARSNGAPRADAQEQQAGLALRQALHAFGGCVGALPGGERRVLLLRANPGASQPRSRAQVGRLLGMSVAGVRTAESRGVADLRQASRTGSCASGSGLATAPAFLIFGAGQPTATRADRSAVLGNSPGLAGGGVRGSARRDSTRKLTASPAAAHPDPPGSVAARPSQRPGSG